MITPFYTGIFTIFFIFLSIKVIGARRKSKIGVGCEGNQKLELLARAHGNFIEYTPLFLIMLFFMEGLVYIKPILLHCLAIAFLIARISHMISLVFIEKYEDRKLKTHIKFRVIGMITTFTILLICSITLIVNSLPQLY